MKPLRKSLASLAFALCLVGGCADTNMDSAPDSETGDPDTLTADDFVLPHTSPLSLLPPDAATHTVARSGNWSDPEIWTNGTVPNELARVLVPAGLTVTVDGEIAARLQIVRIDGTLRFSTETDTALNVETIVQGHGGTLEIGTRQRPVPRGTTARITIIDEGDLTLLSDQWEKGLILLGKTVAHGAEKTAWSRLALNPSRGETTLTLESTPTAWEAGDRLVITGTDATDVTGDEVATLASVSGTTITLSAPLTKDHVAPAPNLRAHVANLSRNILIESEGDPAPLDRGHIMFMHTHDVDFNYVRIHKMGRTRKDIPIDDWYLGEGDEFTTTGLSRRNVRGRYSIHFHRGGVTPTDSPATVTGCVVEDDPGWAYANHSSNVHFDNNVSYDVVGGGFQTEAGDELGSFTNNIAIRTVNQEYPLRFEAPENAPDTREGSQDFAFQGDGFWVHGGGVSLSGNVASGSSGHGFIYWPEGLIEPGFPSGTYRNTFDPVNVGLPANITLEEGVIATGWVPIAGFSNNEAYSATIGLATFYLHTSFFNDMNDYREDYLETVHSTFEDFTAWNVQRRGMELNFTEQVTFDGLRLVNADADPTSVGVWASHYRSKRKQVYRDVNIEGFGTGMMLPPQGQVTVACGTLRNGTNLYIPSPGLSYRDLRIADLTTEPDTAFREPVDIRMEASFSPPEDKFSAFFLLPDKIILDYGPHEEQRLFFDEQAATFRPMPADAEPYTFFEESRYVPPEFAGKSNADLEATYGMSFGGTVLPVDVTTVDNIVGGRVRTWGGEVLNVPVCVDFAKETEFELINQCIAEAGSNKVAGPIPTYTHPTVVCP